MSKPCETTAAKGRLQQLVELEAKGRQGRWSSDDQRAWIRLCSELVPKLLELYVSAKSLTTSIHTEDRFWAVLSKLEALEHG